VAARQFGIENIQAFVPTEVSWQKVLMLLFFGITPVVNQEPDSPDPKDTRSGIYKTKELGEQKTWINPGQYDNPDNPSAHEKWVGKQIWEQTEGEISVFASSLGTTGTLIGNSVYLKKKNDRIQTVGVMRAPDHYCPGPRTEKLLRLVGHEWQPHVDSVQVSETGESYEKSMALSRQGIYAGPSAGLTYVGLLKYFQDRKENGDLDSLRGKNGEVVSAFICPDTPIPYFEEYFKYLDRSYFPEIKNEDLIANKP
jgi:cysteine synthase